MVEAEKKKEVVRPNLKAFQGDGTPSLNLDDEAFLAADSSSRFSVQEPPQVVDWTTC